MNSIYWFSVIPISYFVVKNFFINIEKEHKRKTDQTKLNIYYKQHLQCLQEKGYNYEIEKESDFRVILENKDIKELESCKNTYLNFLMAYRKFKNNNF